VHLKHNNLLLNFRVLRSASPNPIIKTGNSVHRKTVKIIAQIDFVLDIEMIFKSFACLVAVLFAADLLGINYRGLQLGANDEKCLANK
jgi:hypothetical protein